MIQTVERGAKARRGANDASVASDGLPYVIELWNRTGSKPQCVIARAQNAALARAIFKAPAAENPKRKLTLRRNERMLASTE